MIVREVQRRVRRFIVIGVFANRMRVIGGIVVDTVVDIAAVMGGHRRIRILRHSRVSIVTGMRVRRRGHTDQRSNQQSEHDKQTTHANPPPHRLSRYDDARRQA